MRLSNVEILRILSMMFVVMVHLVGASLTLPDISGNLNMLDGRSLWKLSAESVTIVGVNCFTLISGYFGIRATLRGFVKFTLMCLFYSVGIATCVGLLYHFKGTGFPWHEWAESWLVYSHTDLWYVLAYLGLFLLSPMLNAAATALTNRQYYYTMASFALFTVWCGWWWQGAFNPTGYTVLQLVLMYLIGGAVRRWHDSHEAMQKRHYASLGITLYTCGTLATLILSLYLDPIKAFAYNSPAVIVASVGLLLVFISFEFRSRAINLIASTAFAVYLIHKNPYIWGGFIKPFAIKVWEATDCGGYTLFTIGFTLAVYLACSLIDLLRQVLFSRIPYLR